MTNDDLKRFYTQNSTPEKSNDFVRYNANGEIPGVGGNGGEHETVVIDALPTATQGEITQEQLTTLQKNDANTLLFADEIYRLSDKRTSEGYLIYSHACQDNTDNFYIKCITITISTLGWVLTSLNSASKEELNKVVNNEVQIKTTGNGFMAGGAYDTPDGIAIGLNAKTNTQDIGHPSIAIGKNASATPTNSIAIGKNARLGVSALGGIQLGEGTNSTKYSLQVRDDNIYNCDTHTLTVQNIELNGKKLEKKYQHNIVSSSTYAFVSFSFISTQAEIYATFGDIQDYLNTIVVTDTSHFISASGNYFPTDGKLSIIGGIYFSAASISLYICPINFDSTTGLFTKGLENTVQNVIGRTVTVKDTVVEL